MTISHVNHICLRLAAMVLLVLAPIAAATDMEVVKTRIVSSLSTGLASSSTIQTYQADLQADGTWPDIDYASTAQTYWPPRTHLARMKAMAQAYRWDASMLGDTVLRDGIFRAFDAWMLRDPQSTNWWYQSIGTPQALGEIMLLMESGLSAERLAAGANLIARSYVPRATNSGTNTGANRVDRSYATMMRALLTNDSALTSEAFLSIGDTILVNSAYQFAEGIQPDGSFQQHGPQLYDAGYGYGYTQGLMKFASWGAGTGFAFGNRQMRVLVDYLLDGPQWMVRGNTIDFTAYGRGLSRPGSGTMALGYGAAIDNALAICGGYRQAELAAFLQRITSTAAAGAAVPADALTGNRNFWKSDHITHHRPGFSISLKTSSTRTLQPETGNGEGLKNLHLADGVTLIQRTGNEYDEIMPAWDWRRLPGTTTEQGTYSLKPSADWGVYGTSTHAGSVSNGTNGAAAFAYNRLGVSAKKSWFFLGDVMLALGADINAPAATQAVVTTLNQTRLSGPVVYRTSGGTATLSGIATPAELQWVHHDGTGYFFPNPVSNGTIAAETQTGNWQSINNSFTTDPVNIEVFSLGLHHGTAVSGGSYAYIVAPGIGESGMDGFPLANYQILRNDATVQAAKDQASGITCANFWTAGSVDGIASDAKACVMMTRGTEFLDLAVSDPTQSNIGNITLETDFPVAGVIRADTGLTVVRTTPTLRVQFNAASSYGRTFTARFHLRANAYETVSLEPVADAYAYDANPATNYGSSTDLVTKLITAATGWSRESFLRFDLSGIDRVPVAASLRLVPRTVQTAGIQSVQPVPVGSWTETGLTWNNRPAPDGPPTAMWRPVAGARTSANVLPAVLARSSNEVNLMVAAFAPTNDGLAAYGSRESTDPAQRPVLDLVLPRPEMPTIASPADGVILTGAEAALVLSLTVPAGSSPAVVWSKLSGPGEVDFADAGAVETSAAFSEPGAYVLQSASTVGSVTDIQQVAVNVMAASDPTHVLRMKLDETSGSIAADDAGGNTGTLVGGVIWQPTGGFLSGAAEFDGTSGQIVVPDSPALDVGGSFTLAFRFRPDALITNCGLVSKRVTFSSENAFSTFLDSSSHLNVDVDTNNNRFASNATFGNGLWHHIVVVFDGSLPSAQRVRLYVNGVLDKTATETSATVPNSSGSLVIGSLNGPTGPFFDGRIDDVRLHKRALAEWEIAAVAAGCYAPQVATGAPPAATTGFPAPLAGSAISEITGALVSRWTKTSGPGSVLFADAANPSTTATFDRSGNQRLRLEASNPVATVFQEMPVAVGANPDFWADWQGVQWPGVTDANIISETADPDHDGLSNLLEWALGLDPAKAGSPPLALSPIGAEWAFTYQRPAARQGVTYAVEVSDDLTSGTWTTEGVTHFRLHDGEPESWRATCPPPPAGRLFFRLKVLKP